MAQASHRHVAARTEKQRGHLKNIVLRRKHSADFPTPPVLSLSCKSHRENRREATWEASPVQVSPEPAFASLLLALFPICLDVSPSPFLPNPAPPWSCIQCPASPLSSAFAFSRKWSLGGCRSEAGIGWGQVGLGRAGGAVAMGNLFGRKRRSRVTEQDKAVLVRRSRPPGWGAGGRRPLVAATHVLRALASQPMLEPSPRVPPTQSHLRPRLQPRSHFPRPTAFAIASRA